MGTTYYLLGSEQTERGLGYKVLDVRDATIDVLSKEELAQAESMGFTIKKMLGEASPNTRHVAIHLHDTSIGILFRVRDKQVTALPFDIRGFYHLDELSSKIEFPLEEGTKVRVFAFVYNTEASIVIRNRVSKDRTQMHLYQLDSVKHTYCEVYNTGWIETNMDNDARIMKKHTERIGKEIEYKGGYVSSCTSGNGSPLGKLNRWSYE